MQTPLRIITFNFMPIGYQLLTDWIHRNGHKHILAVTTPGPKSRPTPSYVDVVKSAPRNVDVLVTTRLRKVATPLIRELKPDLITCLSFPYRITPELCSIPTYGAVNLHPAVLPAYRGPNVMRQFYEGAPVFGATAHWIAPEYDTGNILSQKFAPMPESVTTAVMAQWGGLIVEAIAEGMERAIAGDPGSPQNDGDASYAAPFTEDELWIDWNDSASVIQRKAVALSMAGRKAQVRFGGEVFRVLQAEAVVDENVSADPSTIISRSDDKIVAQSADHLIKLTVEPLEG